MMRILLTLLGMAAIVSYAVLGAILMNNWAVIAASGVPLETTIAGMDAAGQDYTNVPGFVFASLGILLGVAWGVKTFSRRFATHTWTAVSLWGGIIALGAPAYFFTSFSNMNSVGDTYFDWNAEAAFALEVPLYAISGISCLVVVAVYLHCHRSSGAQPPRVRS